MGARIVKHCTKKKKKKKEKKKIPKIGMKNFKEQNISILNKTCLALTVLSFGSLHKIIKKIYFFSGYLGRKLHIPI